jgi:hypothetical protein
MSLKAGDRVKVKIKNKNNRMYYLADAFVETISECRRYIKVKGRASWCKKASHFYINAYQIEKVY